MTCNCNCNHSNCSDLWFRRKYTTSYEITFFCSRARDMNKMVCIYFYHNFLKLTSACRRTTRGWRDMIYSALPFLPTGKHWRIIWTTVVERSTLHLVNGGTGTGHNCHLEPYSQSYLSSNIPVVLDFETGKRLCESLPLEKNPTLLGSLLHQKFLEKLLK